ncbi:hypothetical protein GCM10011574_55930 [Microbispora bryophytorum]|uniref:Uncharacterized protein n=1 Tax=Microbispora bryophytorum TaxID=1460882 RepID=A0A8H9LG14_9ACTN|nr:hypothetical protein GCM10011574_55930 [Microbispora bryophytorum]
MFAVGEGRPADKPFDYLGFGQRPAQLSADGYVEAHGYAFAVDENTVAVKNHEFNRSDHLESLIRSRWFPAGRVWFESYRGSTVALRTDGSGPGPVHAHAKSRRNYVGTSPITRASGKKKVVLARFVHNDRLIDALGAQAFAALSASPGARAYYDELRAREVGCGVAIRSP